MGLLGAGAGADNQQPQYASLDDFLKSDQAMALAAGLLSNTGTGKPFSAGLGAGLLNMEAQKGSGLDNQIKQQQILKMQREAKAQQDLANALGQMFNPPPQQPNMPALPNAQQNMPAMPGAQQPLPTAPSNQLGAAMASITPPSMPNVPTAPPGAPPGQPNTAMAPMTAPASPNQPASTPPLTLAGGSQLLPDARKKLALAYAANGDMDKALKIAGLNVEEKTALEKNLIAAGFTPGTPQYQQAIMLGISKPSMQLSVDPATGAVNFTQNVLPNGWIKDPKMGPSRGGQGGTYIDEKTGQAISTDTNKQTSQDQLTVAAISRLEPMMGDIIKNLPQFQHASTRAAATVEGLANNYFGANYELPSQLAAGKSSLNAVPDPLLKILGIPSTDEGLKTVRGIVEPMSGESEHFYKQRVIKQLIRFKQDYDQQAKNRLQHGILLNGQEESPQDIMNRYNPGGQQQSPQQAAPAQPSMDLNSMAQKAIAAGADPAAVKQRLMQLQQGR